LSIFAIDFQKHNKDKVCLCPVEIKQFTSSKPIFHPCANTKQIKAFGHFQHANKNIHGSKNGEFVT
jgi:hypothetical protein